MGITDKYVYRFFYGGLITALVFGMIWETIHSFKVPVIPLTTLFFFIAMSSSESVQLFLSRNSLPGSQPPSELPKV